MQTLLALQSSISTGQVVTMTDLGLTYANMGIYAGIAALACGIVLGILLTIVGGIFGARVGFGGAFLTMALFGLAVCGTTFGLLYLGQVTIDDIGVAASYNELSLAMPYGFKVFLISLAAGFIVMVLVLSGIAKDAQGDRAALGSVLFVSIIMLAAGAAAFWAINYGLMKFALSRPA